MKNNDDKNSIAKNKLGNPTYVWQSGQDRRLQLIESSLKNNKSKTIIDLGCGVGAYAHAINQKKYNVFGLDIEHNRIMDAKNSMNNPQNSHFIEFCSAVGEALPFKNNIIDAIILNEVIEHVNNEVMVIQEINRVLKINGIAIIFAPNILFPFETHGCYIRGKFIFKNIPLINWLPRKIRNVFVPHARIYSKKEIVKLFSISGLQIDHHGYVFPGFNNLEKRSKILAKILRWILYRLENKFFAKFGISHFMIVKKIN
ncbi:MAG: class I SAM-dependent methyltransferase [Dehalococcoidia bacterium]|nr:class I SAM-dependent methyltransferase [Dehalococcoidia bacterium]